MTGADALEWAVIADSAARLVDTAQALTDDDLCEASALPGWTRAHVLTHVTYAADSRTRLLRLPGLAVSASSTLRSRPAPKPSRLARADRREQSAPAWIVPFRNV